MIQCRSFLVGWVWGAPNITSQVSRNYFPGTRLGGGQTRNFVEWMPCTLGRIWVISLPRPSGGLRWPFVGALSPSWCSAPPNRRTAGAGGMVHVLLTPRRCHIFCNRRDSKLLLWSLCNSWVIPKRHKELVTRASATVEASWLGLA
jgi:hypothetical protein